MPGALDQTDRLGQSDTRVVFDPETYVTGVPYDALARLRGRSPVVWVDEVPVLGWPGGPGFWLVLRHADVESVLRQPRLLSSWLGATQIRDPATAEALGYVRAMMLNMDPPEHSRLRRLLSRSFTPRAVARLERRIRGHARGLCARVLAGPRGECDFAKDLAADLPLAVHAGDKVVVSFASVNRDETVFRDADRFDIRRHPNPYLAFGHGPHFCLGAHLARAQMRALFDEVLARTSSLSHAGEPSYLRSNFQRGVKRLPIAWTS
jgi:cytochrome P450